MDRFCGNCGAELKPLATSLYCPNDCDRKSPERLRLENALACPTCRSLDTEPFADCNNGDMHCNPCGAVWWGPNATLVIPLTAFSPLASGWSRERKHFI